MSDQKTAKLDLRLPPHERRAIECLATSNGRSMAAEVRAAIARHVATAEQVGSAEAP